MKENKKPQLKIVSKKKIELEDKKRFYFEIILSDGSQWACDSNGENWKRAKFQKDNLSDDELLSGLFKKNKGVIN